MRSLLKVVSGAGARTGERQFRTGAALLLVAGMLALYLWFVVATVTD